MIKIILGIFTSYAQVYYPTYKLQDGVATDEKFVISSVRDEKILDKSIPVSKLNKNPADQPAVGYVIKWSSFTNDFILSPDIPTSTISGGVDSVFLGLGLVGNGTTITNTGNMILNIATNGENRIPYFNTSGQLVFSSPSSLSWRSTTSQFSFINQGELSLENDGTGQEVLVLDDAGRVNFPVSLEVNQKKICLKDGSNCPLPDSNIISILANPPLLGGGSSGAVNIAADVGTSPGQLLQMDSNGALPLVNGSNITGVIHQALPGQAISVSEVLGVATVGVRMGALGLAQEWQPMLDNLGELQPTLNYLIMGDGSNFYMSGGVQLQTIMGLVPGNDIMAFSNALADINALTYPPPSNKYLAGSGTIWTTKDIPACNAANNSVLMADGINFRCSNPAPVYDDLISGELVTNLSEGLRIRNNGQLRFASDNSKYSSIQAQAVTTNKIYTLPAIDGQNNQVVQTDGLGNLTFVTNKEGDVFGPANSATASVPLFSDNSGKNLSAQTTLFVNNGKVGISISTPLNNLSVNAPNMGEGVNVASSFMGTCGLGNAVGCLSHVNFKNSANSFALSQNNLGTTSVNAANGQSIRFQIGAVNKASLSVTGLGIGTTTPTAKLQTLMGGVLGNSYVGETITHGNNWASFTHKTLKGADNNYAILQSNSGDTLINSSLGKNIGFRINNVEKMTLTAQGMLGLNVLNPREKLSLSGGNILLDGQITPTVMLRSNQNNYTDSGDIIFTESDVNWGWIIRHNSYSPIPPSNSSDALQFYQISGSQTGLEKFEMTPDGKFWALITSIGNLSDATLKKEITSFRGNPAEIMDQFRPVEFSWRDKDETHIGFLAQEVEKIDSRFVVRNPVNGRLMIKYDEILPLMIGYLKSLNEENWELIELIQKREEELSREEAIFQQLKERIFHR